MIDYNNKPEKQLTMQTRSERVKEFTEQSSGITLPTAPRPMTRKEVEFIVRMNCEELMELLMTVIEPTDNVKDVLQDIVKQSNPPVNYSFDKDKVDIINEQCDAFVDIDYYNCNAASKVGMNVDDFYNQVHEANMNKKFPDGTFHRNESGKVIKPPGWQEADTVTIVNTWIEKGTWTL